MDEINKMLEKVGLQYSDLTQSEKETYQSWMDALQKNKVTLSTLKEYISKMKFSVEEELTKTSTGSKQDLFLKARLRNYMLLEAFLTTPEKAKEAIERSLSGMVRKV